MPVHFQEFGMNFPKVMSFMSTKVSENGLKAPEAPALLKLSMSGTFKYAALSFTVQERKGLGS